MHIYYCPVQNRIIQPVMLSFKPEYVFKIYAIDLEVFNFYLCIHITQSIISSLPELEPCSMKSHYIHSEFCTAVEKYLASICIFKSYPDLLNSY